VGGRSVPAHMPEQVDRLALFGDTGCRIKSGTVQDCASPEAWPLAIISDTITRDHPDAALFAGDFFYRGGRVPGLPAGLARSRGPALRRWARLPITDSAYGWICRPRCCRVAPTALTRPRSRIVSRGDHRGVPATGGNGYFLHVRPAGQGTEGTCAPVATGATGLTAAPTTLPGPTYAVDLPGRARVARCAWPWSTPPGGRRHRASTPFAAVQRPAYERAAALAAHCSGPGVRGW